MIQKMHWSVNTNNRYKNWSVNCRVLYLWMEPSSCKKGWKFRQRDRIWVKNCRRRKRRSFKGRRRKCLGRLWRRRISWRVRRLRLSRRRRFRGKGRRSLRRSLRRWRRRFWGAISSRKKLVLMKRRFLKPIFSWKKEFKDKDVLKMNLERELMKKIKLKKRIFL